MKASCIKLYNIIYILEVLRGSQENTTTYSWDKKGGGRSNEKEGMRGAGRRTGWKGERGKEMREGATAHPHVGRKRY